MPNIKSQKKRVRTNELARQRNMAIRTRMKSQVKLAEAALAGTDQEAIKTAVKKAVSEIDRAASKGVIHPKSASRRKSTLERRSAESSTSGS